MNEYIIVEALVMRLAIVCSIAVFAAAACAPAFAATISAGPGSVLLQYGDYHGSGGGYGGSSASSASGQNMRVSFLFTAIPVMAGKMLDSSGSEDWTKYWDTGLGGGMGLAYQFVPGMRFGVSSGYHTFPGKNVNTGWFDVKFENIQCIPVMAEAVFSFPFGISASSWFSGNDGFVEGPAPYIGIEVGGIYRPGVKFSINGTMSTDNYFEDSFTFAFGVHAGFEFRMSGFAFFLDFGYRYYTPPEKNSSLSTTVKEMTAVPVRAGIAFYFGGKGGSGRGY